jgi:4-amino-4-deoxy-L-arabinose transferase-like glycosyltransferase
MSGLHYDASSELGAFYPCCSAEFKPVHFGHPVPVMILSYLGAFKAWLYYPLLRYLEVTPFVLRVPLLLIGTASVGLFFALLDRTIGRRAAIAGAILLATDGVFLIATTYDFGPVALLHFFLLSGILLLLSFERKPGYRTLALAFFVFGLALWHKALFIWMLDGLIVAAVVVFPRRILALVTPLRLAVAAISLCAGALPLIYFNVVTRGATLRIEQVMSDSAPISQKLRMFRITMSGNVLFGWLTEEAQPAAGVAPGRRAAKVSVAISRLFHVPVQSNGMFYAFLVSCCLVPWLWFTNVGRATLFVVIYLTVTWAQMVALPNTGASLHHVLLLWPFPHFLIAIVGTKVAEALGRPGIRIAACVLALMVVSNLLLINQYYADLATKGTTAIWTDAVYPLFDYLDSLSGSHIIATDWGYATTLCLLSDGQMPLSDISYTLLGPSPAEAAWIRSLMDDPRNLFVQHAPGSEQFATAGERLASLAAQANRAREVLRVVADRHHRPRFEIVRYAAKP